MNSKDLALFVMLGQTATNNISNIPEVAPSESLNISESYDLAKLLPETVHQAIDASESYKLFFVFESYLRSFIVDILSNDSSISWWDRLPKNIQDDVIKLEANEDAKNWMALGSRSKIALVTYPQLLAIIDELWKDYFEDIIRDKALINEARLLSHLRNNICHMATISSEENARIKQTMRDWFRKVAP